MEKTKAKLTRKEAITKLSGFTIETKMAEKMIDFYVEAGMLEIVEEDYVNLETISGHSIVCYLDHVISQLARLGFTVSKGVKDYT